jgi:tetratricopeptide (TPR) repeat protein
MFFDRFRTELSRYAEGVHDLPPPASEAKIAALEARLGSMPQNLVSLLSSWDGLRLFAETYVFFPATEIVREKEGLLAIGEGPEGQLLLDANGRTYLRSDEGERVLLARDLERLLALLMVREGQLIDREGEWKEVFDQQGEIRRPIRQKQIRAGLKVEPESAALHLEAAELAFEQGDEFAAEAALRRSTEIDPNAAAAWSLLGGLLRRSGRFKEAASAFAEAARASTEAIRRARYEAESARAAGEAGDEQLAREMAARARRDAPTLVETLKREAEEHLELGDRPGAHNLASLLQVLAPDERGTVDLERRLRLLDQLRTI